MHIFLDTANIDQIRQAAKLGIISGVTTNPSLMSNEAPADYEAAIKEICSIIPGPISAEVLVEGVEPMIKQARHISTWAPNVVIKIPATAEGLEVASILAKDGIMVFYGETWQEAVLPFQILCSYALIRHVGATTGPILIVVKEVRRWNHITYLNVVLLLVLIVPAMKLYGLVGVSILMVLTTSLNVLLGFCLSTKALGNSLICYVKHMMLPILACLLSTMATIIVSNVFDLHITDYGSIRFLPNVVILIAKSTVFFFCYSCLNYVLDISLRADLRTNLSGLVRRSTLKKLSND